MSILPLHLQRRFEQRWAARVASLVGTSGRKNLVSKGSPINVAPRATRAKERPARLRRRNGDRMDLSECSTEKEMNSFWRHVKHELSDERHATLILAVIAGFTAWIITHFLRVVFG